MIRSFHDVQACHMLCIFDDLLKTVFLGEETITQSICLMGEDAW